MRLCWRHWFDLQSAAFGSLLDLNGILYPRWARRILDEANVCQRCTRKRARA